MHTATARDNVCACVRAREENGVSEAHLGLFGWPYGLIAFEDILPFILFYFIFFYV